MGKQGICMKRIVVITDMSDEGSGYKNICVPLLTGLAQMGHEIKVAGIGYTGKEHNYPFSVIPAYTIQDAHVISHNLHFLWQPDLYIVAMDIPLQEFFYNNLKGLGVKYMAITPLENGPLTMSWAAILLNMDYVWFISELGKQEALKAGLTKVDHLIVGVDTVLWHPATFEEKKQLRSGLGIADNEFVVLTVADNQERKNLWAGMESVRLLKEQTDRKVRYILVTRKDSPVGWKLDDLSIEMGLTKEMMIFNRGLPVQDLWGLYAVADVYLQPSKAEGLGMPVLEAMACGVPCLATDTGALHELLDENRGYLAKSAYWLKDVWGNEKRDFLDIYDAANWLEIITLQITRPVVKKALEFVRAKTWDIPVQQVHQKIEELFSEQK
jgi:glycosyltransferase involved in cell wall biosynthesis